jgi:hypothetical protein
MTLSENTSKAREVKAIWDARKAQLDVEIRQKQKQILEEGWHSVEVVRAQFNERWKILLQRINLVPKSAARDAAGIESIGEVERIIEEHIREALTDLSSDDIIERLERKKSEPVEAERTGKRGRPRNPNSPRKDTKTQAERALVAKRRRGGKF